MKTVAIIQARMGSTRLPAKVLRSLCGRSMISHVLERVAAAPRVDEVWLATSVNLNNDPLAAEVEREGHYCFRGSEEDVLARFHETATKSGADIVIRINGDCPLYDPVVLDRMLERFHAGLDESPPSDFMSNAFTRKYPRGLDTEVFTFDVLDRLQNCATKPNEREHVTPYVYHHLDEFHPISWVGEGDHAHYRWVVDTAEDWQLIETIYEALWTPGKLITTQEVLNFLAERPELPLLNAHVEQAYSAEQKAPAK